MVGFKTGIKRENDGARGSDLVEGLGKDVLVLISDDSGCVVATVTWSIMTLVAVMMAVLAVFRPSRKLLAVVIPAAVFAIWILDSHAYVFAAATSSRALYVDAHGGAPIVIRGHTIAGMITAMTAAAVFPQKLDRGPLWVSLLVGLRLAVTTANYVSVIGVGVETLALSLPTSVMGCVAAVSLVRPSWVFLHLSARRHGTQVKASRRSMRQENTELVSKRARKLKIYAWAAMIVSGCFLCVPGEMAGQGVLPTIVLVTTVLAYALIRASTLAHEGLHAIQLRTAQGLASSEPDGNTSGQNGAAQSLRKRRPTRVIVGSGHASSTESSSRSRSSSRDRGGRRRSASRRPSRKSGAGRSSGGNRSGSVLPTGAHRGSASGNESGELADDDDLILPGSGRPSRGSRYEGGEITEHRPMPPGTDDLLKPNSDARRSMGEGQGMGRGASGASEGAQRSSRQMGSVREDKLLLAAASDLGEETEKGEGPADKRERSKRSVRDTLPSGGHLDGKQSTTERSPSSSRQPRDMAQALLSSLLGYGPGLSPEEFGAGVMGAAEPVREVDRDETRRFVSRRSIRHVSGAAGSGVSRSGSERVLGVAATGAGSRRPSQRHLEGTDAPAGTQMDERDDHEPGMGEQRPRMPSRRSSRIQPQE